MNAKQSLTIVVGLALIALSFALGYYLGGQKGEEVGRVQTEQRLEPLVNTAFPKPPTSITNLSGTIKGFSGATLVAEVIDPDDYLPHTDRTPQRTETRVVNVLSTTQITLIGSPDQGGNVKLVSLKLADLKIGDKVSITSDKNIRDLREFSATKIEVYR
ncbi:hypothetical protein HY967_04090 [Candidatus Jorgensenbacteria bacterium]|nr:hypothetical protein [Candidatus Jorgensenbacteria bacterium]